MSLRLRRIELENFRSHKHIIFEPEFEGITALQGVNGTGKSSILDAAPWVLFGSKPAGVSKATEMFRTLADPLDKAFARVDLDVDNKHYRFERRRVNKHGAIECEVFTVETVDGEEKLTNVAGPAVSHAENYIRKLLKMDEKGFLAAIFVQQKQVDQLISTGPRERGAVIEKLTGIAGITVAVTEAKQELNTLKKAAALSSIDEAGLEKLRKEALAADENLVALKEKQSLLRSQAGALKADGIAKKEQLDVASSRWDRKNAIETRTIELNTRKELKDEELTRTNAEKEEERRSRGTSDMSYEELEEKIKGLETQRRELSLRKSKNEDSLSNFASERKTLEAESLSLKELKGSPEALKKDIDALVLENEGDENDIIELKSELEQLQTAIDVISHGDSCPTCLQKVDDSVSAVKALQKTADSITKRREKLLKNSKEVSLDIETKKTTLSGLVRRDEIVDRLAVIKSEYSELRKAIDAAGSELRVLDKEFKSVQSLFDEAKRNRDRDRAYRRLLEKAQKLTSEVEDIEFELKKLKTESAELGNASQRDVSSLQKSLDEIRSKHSSISMEFTTKTGEVKLLQQKIDHLASDIKRHEEDIAKHNELIQSVTVAAAAHEVISEFREERIRNSIPVIEVYASDLLNRFTEGKFTRLSLNQKFEATVYLADGKSRAVGLLSGGELSAAAMALRLAVSMLLNAGAAGHNLIILDEVLVSQDANRAEQILVTIKEVFKGQVVLIAHNESIDSVADKIVTLSDSSNDSAAEESE